MSEKRFPASAKRLLDAARRGDLPRAPLLTRAGALLGAILGLWWRAPRIVEVFTSTPWLDWSLLWWTNTNQLLSSLAIVIGLSGAGAYLCGSLAGGFVFSGPLVKSRSGGLDRMSLLSLGIALSSAALVGWLLVSRLGALAWLGIHPQKLSSLLLSLGLLFAGVAVGLGVGQAVLSWYLWNQRHRRSYQEFVQDTKDEEGAKRYFLSRLNKR